MDYGLCYPEYKYKLIQSWSIFPYNSNKNDSAYFTVDYTTLIQGGVHLTVDYMSDTKWTTFHCGLYNCDSDTRWTTFHCGLYNSDSDTRWTTT